jgi:hypothetical protein
VIGVRIRKGTDAGGVHDEGENARHAVRRGSSRRRTAPPASLNA